jgi:hypothetical protein
MVTIESSLIQINNLKEKKELSSKSILYECLLFRLLKREVFIFQNIRYIFTLKIIQRRRVAMPMVKKPSAFVGYLHKKEQSINRKTQSTKSKTQSTKSKTQSTKSK